MLPLVAADAVASYICKWLDHLYSIMRLQERQEKFDFFPEFIQLEIRVSRDCGICRKVVYCLSCPYILATGRG